MKLYIVIGMWDYEGGQVLGVYDSFKKAMERKSSTYEGFDDKNIETIELNEDIEIGV